MTYFDDCIPERVHNPSAEGAVVYCTVLRWVESTILEHKTMVIWSNKTYLVIVESVEMFLSEVISFQKTHFEDTVNVCPKLV